jgi:DNA-binding NarL/FixJ family response regulator
MVKTASTVDRVVKEVPATSHPRVSAPPAMTAHCTKRVVRTSATLRNTVSAVIRVIVADDHPLMLESVVSRLEADPGVSVVATAANGSEVVEKYAALTPDLVLTDFKMPGLSGAALVKRLCECDPPARVVILTAYDDQALIESGIDAGAVGYLMKSIGGSELLAQVRAAASGGRAFGPEALDALVARFERPPEERHGLSKREREVLALIVDGLTNIEIAARLHVSTETVKSHVSRIYEKLDVRDRASAVRTAIAQGLVDPERR